MSRRRQVETTSEIDSGDRRHTRSSTTAKAFDVVTACSTPLRKKRRAPNPEDDIENSLDLQTPRSKRISGRRSNKLADVAILGKVFEDSDPDEMHLETDAARRTRRRVILDSVEIVTPGKANSVVNHGQRALLVPHSNLNPSIALLSTTAPPSPALKHHRRLKPKENKVASRDVDEIPESLPSHLHKCLERQKQAILNSFHTLPLVVDYTEGTVGPPANAIALQQLSDLLCGSIERGEGNSCLVIGPAGSGKSKIFEESLRGFEEDHRPIVIRLNGHVQHTDRLAIREIARQVVEQTGNKSFERFEIDDDDNPFDDSEPGAFIGSLPPPSHLPSLIASLPSLPRPVVVLLDAFNIFTEQPRQALLYCLLDTVQSCRAGSPSQRGLAVIGLTSRIDVVNFLEKRVKSRFSHRIFRTACMRTAEEWIVLLQNCLCTDVSSEEDSVASEWRQIWEHSVSRFLQDRSVKNALRDMFGISRDIRRLLNTMASGIIRLTPSCPYLTVQTLQQGIELQFSKPRASLLMGLNYPSLSLCIAAQHARTAGHDSFTFEILCDLFTTQVRTSSAAPVMLGGGSIGMVNIGKRVLIGAFEDLVQMKIFVQAAPSVASLRKEFIKYRCVVERDDVKAAVNRIGQTNLKKWFGKAQ